MSHQQIIAQTSQVLQDLAEDQAAEVLDFATFLRQRQQTRAAADAELLRHQIAAHVETADAFAFLHDAAEDVYTVADAAFRYDTPPADATN